MYNTVEFNVKESRIKVKVVKKRVYMAPLRSVLFGDKRKKRTRTRQAELAKALKEE